MIEEEYHFIQEEEFINKTSKESKMTNSELIEIKNIAPEIFRDEQAVKKLIEGVKKAVSNEGFDMNLKKDRKLLASLAMKVAKSKTGLDEIGKNYVAGVKAEIKKIDTVRAYARNELDAIKQDLRKPLTEWEAVEKERVQALESLITHIKEKKRFYKENPLSETVEEISSYLTTLEGLFHHEWQEYLHDAINTIKEAYEQTEKALEQRKRFDEDQKELQELRELQLAQRKKEEEAKLKQRLEAEIKEKLEREEALKLKRVQQEREKKQRLEAEIKSSKAHKDKIINQIVQDLHELTEINQIDIEYIVKLISEEKITNIKINY